MTLRTKWASLGPNVSSGRPFARIGNKELPVVQITMAQAKRPAGLLLIQKDLESAQEALTVVHTTCLDRSQAIVNPALWFSGVLAYTRCFTQATGGGVKLERKDHVAHLSRELVATHDELMRTRNQYVAHAGQSLDERAGARGSAKNRVTMNAGQQCDIMYSHSLGWG